MGGLAQLPNAGLGFQVPRLMRVARVRADSADTFTSELEASEPFAFEPGQFNMLYAPGYGEVPISISGDPARGDTLVHTVRRVGSVTRALGRIEAGGWVGVRGPFGRGWPSLGDPGLQLVVVAGGIGLAPLRPLLAQSLALQRSLFVVYGARAPAQLLYQEELESWAKRARRMVVTVDRGDPHWLGQTGVVTKFIPHLGFDPARAVACVCGPEVMLRFAARTLVASGLPAERIYVSLERNMQCGVGHCGHCQLGPHLLCRTGPVLSWAEAAPLLRVHEL